MKKVVQSSVILISLLFCGFVLSEPRDYYPFIPQKQQQYVFHLLLTENDHSGVYEVVSVVQIDDHLVFDIEKIEADDMKHKREISQKCFFKMTIDKVLETITKHSKIVFSIKDIEKYSLAETGGAYFPLPAPLYLPERLKTLSAPAEPRDPDFPLPAPLPLSERLEVLSATAEPRDPDFPLPAPLPFYISPYTNQLIVLSKDLGER